MGYYQFSNPKYLDDSPGIGMQAQSPSGFGLDVPSWNQGQPQQSGLSNAYGAATDAVTVANPLLGIGLKGVGALAQLFKRDPYKNTRKTAIRGLEARANNPLNVTGLLSRRRMAIMHDASRFGEQSDRFSRFDKGRSFGEFTGNILDQEAGASVDLDLQNEKLKNEIAMFLAQVRG